MLNRREFSEFESDGILRVSGAIPAADIEAMTALVWDNLERRYPFRRNRPDTWTAQRVNGLHALDKIVNFEKIGGTSVCLILDVLFGSRNWQRPVRWGSLLIAFPESYGEWDVPYASWHLDFPASDSVEELFVVRFFTCLQRLRHKGGATLAAAGSHLLVKDLARRRAGQELHSSDVRSSLIRDYPWMNALCSRAETADRIARFMNVPTAVDGAELRVFEMTAEPGDVFLVHPLILHAPSTNCGRSTNGAFQFRI